MTVLAPIAVGGRRRLDMPLALGWAAAEASRCCGGLSSLRQLPPQRSACARAAAAFPLEEVDLGDLTPVAEGVDELRRIVPNQCLLLGTMQNLRYDRSLTLAAPQTNAKLQRT